MRGRVVRANCLIGVFHRSSDLNRHTIRLQEPHLFPTPCAEMLIVLRSFVCPDWGNYGPMLTAGAFSMFTSLALCEMI